MLRFFRHSDGTLALFNCMGATPTDLLAAAIAMAYAPMPSQAGKTSWTANVGFFKGETAFGGSIAHRLDLDIPIALTAGYAYGGSDSHAARIGLQGEF